MVTGNERIAPYHVRAQLAVIKGKASSLRLSASHSAWRSDVLLGLARQHRVEDLGSPVRDRISHQRAQFRPTQLWQRFDDLFVLCSAEEIRLALAAVLHQKEGEERRHNAL